ncbi:L,D-transpeptidase [Aquihabitans sp. G128]|uniref:L,D-transpeptidase n=1 Tax=Aquihabitans sp. G128 TaxID=2849779 RepID=UPI001C212838|nr:L,D-transpeptidase [Aquihabitans sp. G128]QXC61267.1 L,D-transpeptidase [Aquihabitans sp. G128]QXC61319.1 L,D-transpeptidase [Aquihabitans sp. G128]
MSRRRPTATARRPRLARRPLALAVVGLLAVGLLGSCTGERPSLGAAKAGGPTTTTTSTTAAGKASTTTTTPGPKALGPDDLLGYIATPTGNPVVRAEPRDDALPISIDPKTEAGAPTTFAIIGDATAVTDGWYQVLLPTRPNAARAWVPAASVTVTKTPFRIFVDLAGRSLRVEKDAAPVFTADTAIGTTENPTPVGATYVTELIDNVDPDGSYGPYAFGLALHSDTLSEFGGGDGQVGIHGTNQPQKIGQAVSHGCVRLKNADVEGLVDLDLPLGVPVFIT